MEQTAPNRLKKGAPVLRILLGLTLAALVGFAYQYNTANTEHQNGEIPPAASSSSVEGTSSAAVGTAVSAVPGPSPSAAGQQSSEEEPYVQPVPAEPYDFTQPAPESAEVDKSYFADAAFVGDSRTDGFLIYSGVGGGKNLTSNGLSIFKLAEQKALTIGGQEYTLLEALALDTYGKVYLSLGINELGVYDDEGFYRSYCEAIDAIRAIQPQAVIYIQGLIPLNEGVIAQTIKRDYLTNEHLRVYNDLMRKAAQEKQVVFLDLYSHFVDENGELPENGSRDGVHLTKPYCQEWLAYLQTHTVDFDTLYPDGLPQEEPAEGENAENGSVET